MKMIDVVAENISEAVQKDDEFYKVVLGDPGFTPQATITDPEHVQCGAICNELEYARFVTDYYVKCLTLEGAENGELNELISSTVTLPRRNDDEPDATYRNRFKMLVVQKTNYRRHTKWAILDALSYFLDTSVNPYGVYENPAIPRFFEVRIVAPELSSDDFTLDSYHDGFLDNDFISGRGIGTAIIYITELLSRITSVGVSSDIIFIGRGSVEVSSTAHYGGAQMETSMGWSILGQRSMTTTSQSYYV